MLSSNKPTFYFFCCEQGPPDEARYQYGILPLAEGLRELDVPFYSNVNYWQLKNESSKFLFEHDKEVTPDDCDVVVLNDRWFRYGNPLPKNLFKKNRKYRTVYIDCADGVFTRSFKPKSSMFDHIFRAHLNKRMYGIPKNVKPWAFGLPNRIIHCAYSELSWADRNPVFLSNFRVYHSLRATARRVLHPIIQFFFTIDETTDNFVPPVDSSAYTEWKRTGRRHNPSYYEKLKQSQAVSCFGGQYAHPIAYPLLVRKALNRISNNVPQKIKVLSQWDSFRLWEAFAAGCLVFHIDFRKQGCTLPIMPENGQEYIGVDLKNPKKTFEWLKDLEPEFETIALRGRQWALEHYAPLATAKRFLSELGC